MGAMVVQVSPDSAFDLCSVHVHGKNSATTAAAKASTLVRAAKNFDGPLKAPSDDLSVPDAPVPSPGPGSAMLAAEHVQRAHPPYASTGNLTDVPALQQQDTDRCSTSSSSSSDVPAQRRRRVRSATSKLPTPPPSPFEQWSAIPFTKPLPPSKDVQVAPTQQQQQQQQLDQHPRLKQRTAAVSLSPASTSFPPAPPLLSRASRTGAGPCMDALAMAVPEPDMTAAMPKASRGSSSAALQQQQQQAWYFGGLFAGCMFCAPRVPPC